MSPNQIKSNQVDPGDSRHVEAKAEALKFEAKLIIQPPTAIFFSKCAQLSSQESSLDCLGNNLWGFVFLTSECWGTIAIFSIKHRILRDNVATDAS